MAYRSGVSKPTFTYGMIKDISVFTQCTQGSLQTVFELSRAY